MNGAVIKSKCECCSCNISGNVNYEYIFNENEPDSSIQNLIFECIGKVVIFNGSSQQQLICAPCLQQLNQIKDFKTKCSDPNDDPNTDEYREIVNLEDDETQESYSKSSLDDCEDYEVLEDFLDDDIEVTPLKYLEQIEYKSIADVFAEIEFEGTVLCCLCNIPLISHTNLVKHLIEDHADFDHFDSFYYPCIVENLCHRFNTLKEVNDHILIDHYPVSQNPDYSFQLKCLTCNNKFLDKVEFGKHNCNGSDWSNHTELVCAVCSMEFKSRLKMAFHYQFHRANARPKICLICLIKFNSDMEFYEHVMYFHESSQSYLCSYCDQTFAAKHLRQMHEKTHTFERNHLCKICNKTFSDEQTLSEHRIGHLKNKPFKCPICNKQLNRASRLRKHIASHEEPKFSSIFACEVCDLSYSAKNHVIEHIRSVHHNVDVEEINQFYSRISTDRVYCCEYCAKVYRTSTYLNEHRAIHENISQPFECEYCSSTYDSFSKLRTHKIAHEKHKNSYNKFPVQKLFLCRYDCDKSYRHWPDLSHHMNTVHLAKPITCKICYKTFPFLWNYSYHKKIEHTKHVTVACSSDGCNREFHTKKEYLAHKKQEHTTDSIIVKRSCRKCKKNLVENERHVCIIVEGVITCEHCGKIFQGLNAVKTHIKVVHDRVINHNCEFCNRGFYNISDKNIHVRIHTQEKPYRCTTCSYECRTQSTLTEHIRTHTNDRPYSCPYPECGSSFRRSYAMKTHFKIHTGERNFKCSIDSCTKTFRSKSQLNYHWKKKHSNSDTEQIEIISNMMEGFSDAHDNISMESDTAECNFEE